jgi:hypothetical protein
LIPIGPIIWAAAAASRHARGQPTKTDPRLASFTLRLFAGVLLVPLCLAIYEGSPPLGVMGLAILFAVMFPTVTLSGLLVPLGAWREAYYFARIFTPLWLAREPASAGVFFGALAAIGRRRVDARAIAWLRFKATSEKPRGVGVAAAGLLAAAEGNADQARLLFDSIDDAAMPNVPRRARGVARDWLVADALVRGDWPRAALLGRRGGASFRWAFAMGRIAERLTGAPGAPSDLALRLFWLLSPHRRQSLPWLRRALTRPRTFANGTVTEPQDDLNLALDELEGELSGSPLDAALKAHAECLRSPTEARVLAAARVWEAALSASSTRALLERRVLALEAPKHSDVLLSELRLTVEKDLLPHAALVSSRASVSPLLQAITSEARSRSLDEIETVAQGLKQRATNEKALDTLEEWMEWGALKGACEGMLENASDDTRHAVFTVVYRGACGYAVWLFNRRTEKFLANSIFRWLLALAKRVEDEASIELLKKNVASGDGF